MRNNNHNSLRAMNFFLKQNLEVKDKSRIEENLNKLADNLLGTNFRKSTEKIVSELNFTEEKVNLMELACNDKENKRIVIDFKQVDKLDKKKTIFCIAAGLPNEYFIEPELFSEEVKLSKKDETVVFFIGEMLGGSLAQYCSIMTENDPHDYKTLTWNGIGIESFTEFRGNEFLGYEKGVAYFLNDRFKENRNMEILRVELIAEGVIEEGNVSQSFRRTNRRINQTKLKRVLKEIFIDRSDMKEKQAENYVEENFNPELINRKMRFIDNYRKYFQSKGNEKQNIVNYVMYDNFPARIFNDIGVTYIVDNNLKKEEGISDEWVELIGSLEGEEVKRLTEHNFDLFEPFILLEEGGSGSTAVNRLGNKPQVGNMTNNLSYDYLRALIKDIIIDLHNKNEKLVTEIFKKCRRHTSNYLIDLITDRLQHSMKLKGLLAESEVTYESYFLKENPDLFTKEDKIYPLDRAALYQIRERMDYGDLLKLWDWKLSGEGIFMILGTKLEGDEEPIEYHSSDPELKFTNEREKIKLKLEKPSKNIIYGTNKQLPNYRLEYDTEYRHKEEKSYNFSSGQGVGIGLLTKHVNPENKLKIDGRDIAGTYKQKDRDEVKIGNRKTSLRDEYYGDNIILRNPRRSMGKMTGDLIYIYGQQKEDELRIKGFVSGDYGIKLKRKVKEKEEKKEPITYTPHKVRLNEFQFKILDRFEINKSLYDHTRAVVEGRIDEDNFKKYRRKLSKDKPKVEINYYDDDRKILFKGYVNGYELSHRNHEYYLKLEAISYTNILDEKPRIRIFQNQGTSYGDVFKVIEDKAKEVYDIDFNIVCDDSSLEDKPLVNKDYPVVLQYQETDWEFLQRICSYLNKPIIIDDMKDSSETVNILVGTHAASGKDLNNVTGRDRRKKIEEGAHDFYKVEEHPHYRSKEMFNLGKPVYYKDKFPKEEKTKIRELILIKNKIYVKQGLLYSDLTMAAEDKINIEQQKRKYPPEGTTFLAEVKKVNNKHQAQVKFLNVYNRYQEDKAHWFQIDKMHTNAYFAPEIGDIVEVCFGSRNEKHARITNSSVINGKETNHPPEVKRIQVGENKLEIDGEKERVRAAVGKEENVYLDVTNKKVEIANQDQIFKVEPDKIKFENPKNRIEINEEAVIMQSGDSKFVLDKEKAALKCGDKGITITEDKIKIP